MVAAGHGDLDPSIGPKVFAFFAKTPTMQKIWKALSRLCSLFTRASKDALWAVGFIV